MRPRHRYWVSEQVQGIVKLRAQELARILDGRGFPTQMLAWGFPERFQALVPRHFKAGVLEQAAVIAAGGSDSTFASERSELFVHFRKVAVLEHLGKRFCGRRRSRSQDKPACAI